MHIKHVKEGNGRSLNSYEKDSIKEHEHALNLNLETDTFDIDLNQTHNVHIWGKLFHMCALKGIKTEGCFSHWERGLVTCVGIILKSNQEI